MMLLAFKSFSYIAVNDYYSNCSTVRPLAVIYTLWSAKNGFYLLVKNNNKLCLEVSGRDMEEHLRDLTESCWCRLRYSSLFPGLSFRQTSYTCSTDQSRQDIGEGKINPTKE